MKFTSFLSKLFVHVVLWFALTMAFNHQEVGIENLTAFILGFMGFSTLMLAIVGDGMRTIEVPGSRLGKAAFLLFHWSRLFMVVALAAHAHFFAAFMLALSVVMIYSAYAQVRKFERTIKQAWRDARDSLDAFTKQTSAGAPLEPVNAAGQPKETTPGYPGAMGYSAGAAPAAA
ncbi:hypothetical protein AB6809_29785 [Paraburkholderia sp. RCC_158]|uniref:hypothetical protein n=1 Tax=Paraburkholderia sp. RCC_158 TaxID=3239220 RepID=UPI003526A3BA